VQHSKNSRLTGGIDSEQTVAHLAAIVQSSDDAIISRTPDGTILSWNPGAERLYGYTAAEVMGRSISALLVADRMELENEVVGRVLGGERSPHFETVRRAKNGDRLDLSVAVAPIRDSDGRIAGVSDIAREVAERRRRDEESGRLAAIVQSSEDAVISKTLDGTILTWNKGAEQVYGYTSDEAIGQQMTLVVPDDRVEEEAAILDRIRRREEIQHFETSRRRKNGELIDVSLTIWPIYDKEGLVIGVSHLARDITEQRKMEQRLEQLAAIVESADDAIISKTLKGVILTWNGGAERVYGYNATEAVGKPMTMLFPENRHGEEDEILDRIRRGGRVEHFETVRKTKSSELIDVSLTISPIRDNSGRIIGASHVGRNVSERKRLEEQLRHTQKLESLGILAGGVAHDFNNLLTGILGNASLALESLSSHHPMRSLLRDVVNASERASHLTRQLLAYAGKGRFIIEPIDLSALVREIAGLVQASIPKHVQLRLELRDDLPLIAADASQIQQIIMNLVINGAEAIGPANNGTVLVTTGEQNVDEQYLLSTFEGPAQLPQGMYVTLDVHDTGCGMDEATVKRIFDPFFTTKFTGRGLGLAAVQGIVRGHKGALKVYSTPGKGTTFKAFFPATEETVAVKRPPVAPAAARDLLVLVIDDEEIIRKTAKAMLERYGYTVVLAENGKEGVELFQVLADKVSAVLLDMTMPVMNGEEAFSRMMAIRPDVKVVLSSGFNEVEAIRRFTGKNLAGFIQKPYSAAALGEKIRSVLDL
jgi:PAS domain S-box-containing protein